MNSSIERGVYLSGSQTERNQPYYQHCEAWLRPYLQETLPQQNAKIIFVPWALWGGKQVHTPDMMFSYAQQQWALYNLELIPLHKQPNFKKAIEQADAIIVGGGSMHTLVKALHEHELLYPIHDRVRTGGLYIGTSAGTILACPTFATASENAIFPLPSHDTLNLLPFQISCHYREMEEDEFHPGPTPRMKVINYLTLNSESKPVLCLPNGAFVVRENTHLALHGSWATLLTPSLQELNFQPGDDISMLLDEESDLYRKSTSENP